MAQMVGIHRVEAFLATSLYHSSMDACMKFLWPRAFSHESSGLVSRHQPRECLTFCMGAKIGKESIDGGQF